MYSYATLRPQTSHDVCVCQSYLNEKLTFIYSVCVDGNQRRLQLSFRCVEFRIYAFPILDDISYFCADSAATKSTADDDAPLLLLLSGILHTYTNKSTDSISHHFYPDFTYSSDFTTPPPTLWSISICGDSQSDSVCLWDYQLIVTEDFVCICLCLCLDTHSLFL